MSHYDYPTSFKNPDRQLADIRALGAATDTVCLSGRKLKGAHYQPGNGSTDGVNERRQSHPLFCDHRRLPGPLGSSWVEFAGLES